eukprot:1182-Heterococcus_DN1.PRE.2
MTQAALCTISCVSCCGDASHRNHMSVNCSINVPSKGYTVLLSFPARISIYTQAAARFQVSNLQCTTACRKNTHGSQNAAAIAP